MILTFPDHRLGWLPEAMALGNHSRSRLDMCRHSGCSSAFHGQYICSRFIQASRRLAICLDHSQQVRQPMDQLQVTLLTCARNVWGYGFSKFITPWAEKSGVSYQYARELDSPLLDESLY